MIEFWQNLFSSDFMPHGVCFLWNPGIVWLDAISDGLIALSYFVIPLALFYGPGATFHVSLPAQS